jgi:formate hydrogenlyase subunit 6/NADH:ubiquinone oxidoreductase subunit I
VYECFAGIDLEEIRKRLQKKEYERQNTTARVKMNKGKCSVENLCEHACPTLNHRAENSRVYAALYL